MKKCAAQTPERDFSARRTRAEQLLTHSNHLGVSGGGSEEGFAILIMADPEEGGSMLDL